MTEFWVQYGSVSVQCEYMVGVMRYEYLGVDQHAVLFVTENTSEF